MISATRAAAAVCRRSVRRGDGGGGGCFVRRCRRRGCCAPSAFTATTTTTTTQAVVAAARIVGRDGSYGAACRTPATLQQQQQQQQQSQQQQHRQRQNLVYFSTTSNPSTGFILGSTTGAKTRTLSSSSPSPFCCHKDHDEDEEQIKASARTEAEEAERSLLLAAAAAEKKNDRNGGDTKPSNATTATIVVEDVQAPGGDPIDQKVQARSEAMIAESFARQTEQQQQQQKHDQQHRNPLYHPQQQQPNSQWVIQNKKHPDDNGGGTGSGSKTSRRKFSTRHVCHHEDHEEEEGQIARSMTMISPSLHFLEHAGGTAVAAGDRASDRRTPTGEAAHRWEAYVAESFARQQQQQQQQQKQSIEGPSMASTRPRITQPLFANRPHQSRRWIIHSNDRNEGRGASSDRGASRWFSSSSSSGGDAEDSKERHRLFEEQMLELKEEREALFGFTQDDHDAWTDAARNGHRHDQSFLDEIDRARTEAYEAEQFAAAAAATKGATAASVTSQAGTIANAALLSKASSKATQIIQARTAKSPTTEDTHDNLHDSHRPHESGLTHISNDGTSVHMVDVGSKAITARTAVAQSKVVFPPEVVQAFLDNKNNSNPRNNELVGPKGPIFATAKLAGIMAAKQTSNLIPLCHPLPLDKVDVDIQLVDHNTAVITCTCKVSSKTGVEMEALTGATIAALTIYDMTKAVSHRIRIEGTRLVSKSGGKRTVGVADDEQKKRNTIRPNTMDD